MKTYEQQLVDWSDALSAGHAGAVLDNLIDDCSRRDVERFLENAIGERYRLLTEEMDLVGLAFDDFGQLVDEYLTATPRKTFELHEREQQRFLRWLRGRRLTPQQADFITYQESEYDCYELARNNRVAHLEFQRLWNRSQSVVDEQGELTDYVVHVNPVHVWTRLEIAAKADGSAHEGDVVFLALNSQIRSLWLTSTQQKTARDLIAHSPMRLATWKAAHQRLDVEAVDKVLRELVAGGLLALSSP